MSGTIALGIGSNLGDRLANLANALGLLFSGQSLTFLRASSVYETSPWGVTDQPAFANMVVLARTSLAPDAILDRAKAIESAMGREAAPRWGPRVIDIDLLDMDGVTMATPTLILPHPSLFERAFVVVPLAEIVPDRIVGGRRIADAAHGLQAGPIIAPPWRPVVADRSRPA